MSKPTDIRAIATRLHFLPVETRVPLKFGPETLTHVVCARVRMRVTDGAGRTADGRVGRFGRKAEIATTLDFIDTALRFELGLTTPMNPRQAHVQTLDGPSRASL